MMYVIIVTLVISIISAYIICVLMSLEMLRRKLTEIWKARKVMN